MAIDVTTEIIINRPSDVVAEYSGDPTNAPEWYDNITTVTWKTEPPARVGSRMDFVANFLGRRLAYTYEVVELVAGERMVMRTDEGPFPMETTYTWAARGDATHMTLRNRGEPQGFAKIATPVMAAAVRRETRKNLRQLKKLLELGSTYDRRALDCERSKPACKPGSVPAARAGDGHLSGTPVTRRLERPDPGLGERATPGRRSARSLFGLAPGGVYLAGRSPGRRWALAPPFHLRLDSRRGCVFSVALSFGSPRLGVTQRPALWSPDFPRTAEPPATIRPACAVIVPRTFCAQSRSVAVESS